MTKKLLILVLFASISCGLYGQAGLAVGNGGTFFRKDSSFRYFTEASFSTSFATDYSRVQYFSETLFPDFVKENPRGYSYLCRLELKVEEKLPLGIWFNVGENVGIPGGNAHVRFRLFNF